MRLWMCVAELEVARLSTDGNLADLTFPQSEQHGNSIQLSASTLKQHGKNGTQQIPHLLILSRSLRGLWPLQTSFTVFNWLAGLSFHSPPSVFVVWCQQSLSSSPRVFPQVRSGWCSCCTGTWICTCQPRTPASDWAVRQCIQTTPLLSTLRSSRRQLTRRAIRCICLSLWSSQSNTCR